MTFSAGSGAGPAPGRTRGSDADLPSLRPPQVLAAVGAALLVIGVALFFYSLASSPAIDPAEARSVPRDGTTVSVDLMAEEVYGLYSQDTALSCDATGPGGAAVEITDPIARSQSSPPQALTLSTGPAGRYEIRCDATREVTLNVAEVSPTRERAQRIFVMSGPTMVVGLGSAVAGGIWLIVRRRRHSALVMQRLRLGLDAAAARTAPEDGRPWNGQYTPGPVQTTPWSWPPSAPEAPAQQSRPAPGGYGLAPKPVDYRPRPGSDPRREPPAGPNGQR